MMKIAIITPDYPYKDSNNYIFVKQLVDEWRKLNHELLVFSPQSITKAIFKKGILRPKVIEVNSKYHIYSPCYISFSKIPFLRTISNIILKIAIKKAYAKYCKDCDFIYAHFINSGVFAYYLSKYFNTPFFIASGESTFSHYHNIRLYRNVINHANGIIAVSSEIKNRITLKFNMIIDDKVYIMPNGFNSEKFFYYGKEARDVLGYPKEDFIVSFVGSFIERKGLLNLDSALKEINNDHIKAIYIGRGPLKPSYKNIIFIGNVIHDKIVDYLNASDIFVLPTLNEGSCNAIIEAIACGLPIISSINSFNDDILNDKYSIRVDPKNIEQIKNAILKLYNDASLRKSMSFEALKASEKFPLSIRANNILNYIKSKFK